MKTRLFIISLSALGLITWSLFKVNKQKQNAETPTILVEDTSKIPPLTPGSDIPVSPFFNHYGTEAQKPSADLVNVSKALKHFWLLVKNPDALSVMSNQTIMRSLLGNNPHGLRLIAANHPFLNHKGELLDRWNTPLAFHARSMTDIEIRSAGPDQTLYTKDDLVHSTRPR